LLSSASSAKNAKSAKKVPTSDSLGKECLVGEFFPYQIFCARSYFGDVGVLLNKSARRTSVRCESDGSMLVFDKHDLVELAAEFPTHIWVLRKAACRRERASQLLLKTIKTRYASYQDLAASRIQDHWRTIDADGLRDRHKHQTATKAARSAAGQHLRLSGLEATTKLGMEEKFAGRTAAAAASHHDLPAQMDLVRQDVANVQRQLSSLTKIISDGFQNIRANPGGQASSLGEPLVASPSLVVPLEFRQEAVSTASVNLHDLMDGPLVATLPRGCHIGL